MSSTDATYALIHYDSVASTRVRNTLIRHIDLSVGQSGAVIELVYGRYEVTSNLTGSGEYPHRFRGSIPSLDITVLGRLNSLGSGVTMHHILGRHYVSDSGLQLKFEDPIETLVDAESSTDQAFAFRVKRIDNTSAVAFHLNLKYEVY